MRTRLGESSWVKLRDFTGYPDDLTSGEAATAFGEEVDVK